MELRTANVTRYIMPLREGGSLPALAEADDEFKYKMKNKKIKLDNYEIRIVIKALNELRNESIKSKVSTDLIDEILMKYITALEK